MPCYHPLTGYRSRTVNPSGKRSIVFNPALSYSDWDPVVIPCGQCIGCRLERSRQWAIRCVHESMLYDRNCFVTLTYNDESIQRLRVIDKDSGEFVYSLNLRDIQLFMKKLRNDHGPGIRFFQCGEYGTQCKNCGKSEVYCKCGNFVPGIGRPHHHILLFNFDFSFDQRPHGRPRNGIQLYTSDYLKEAWPHGFSTIGRLNFETAAYTARYITKKINGDMAAEHYGPRKHEYITMSRRPGIARCWYDNFRDDVFPHDYVVLRDRQMKPPKYYERIYEQEDFDDYERIKLERIKFAKMSVHNTPRRLKAREKIALARYGKLVRTLEKEC